MELDLIMNIIEENGYIGLFLWLWFGIFGLPIPNEVVAMTIGVASSMKVLNPFLTFFTMYGGILAALTTCYLFGRYVGRPVLKLLRKRKTFSNAIDSSINMMEKYHASSLTLSYFLPGVRSFVPFLYGFSRLPFKTFAIFSYTGALIWLIITYSIGYWFGDHKDKILQHEKELISILSLMFVSFLAFKIIQLKRKRRVRALNKEL